MGKVVGLHISGEKGIDKTDVVSVTAIKDWGLEGDAHAGDWDRQISIFPIEAMGNVPEEKMSEVEKGGHTENITISGISLEKLNSGVVLEIGTAKIKILHIGKEHYKNMDVHILLVEKADLGLFLKVELLILEMV